MQMSETAQSAQTGARPLFVDLDDTLLLGDSLIEDAVSLARARPLAFLAALASLGQGKARLKQSIANGLAEPRAYLANPAVLEHLSQARAEGRTIVLATAADRKTAEEAAALYGPFDGIIASDGLVNAKGDGKLAAIESWLAENGATDGFDYIGDCAADRPIWRAAAGAWVVAASESDARDKAGDVAVAGWLPRRKATAKDYLRAMRIKQWVKNALVLLPLFLSHQWGDVEKVLACIVTLIAFSLVASATYIWNDILDIPADRAHPRKRERPVASGAISIPSALALSLGCLAVAAGASLIAGGWSLILVLLGYCVATVSYSLFLKRQLLADALMLALLFCYRIFAGGIVADIPVSDWLAAFAFFVFFGLALVKRYAEVAEMKSEGKAKAAGRAYLAEDDRVLQTIGVASGFAAITTFCLYITDPSTKTLYENGSFLWIVVIVLTFWLSRLWILVDRGLVKDDPVLFAVHDAASLCCGFVCGAAVLMAI